MTRLGLLFAVVIGALGCTAFEIRELDAARADAGLDAAMRDAGTDSGRDAGSRADAERDAGVDAAAAPDAGDPDAGVPSLVRVIDLGVGDQHSCAVLSDGTVSCWGYNGHGQLGDGTTTGRSRPVRVAAIDDAVEVACMEYSTCVLRRGGTASCWGRNDGGQLGRGTTTPSEVAPADVTGLTDAVSIGATGGNFACVRRMGGQVACWGNNNLGQCATGAVGGPETSPRDVSSISDAVDLAVGRNHACVRPAAGEVACWGDLGAGGCGWGCASGASPSPMPVTGVASSVALAAAGWHACAAMADGTARCWGRNLYGEVGDSTMAERRTPFPVSGLIDTTLIGAGGIDSGAHSCAVTAAGAMSCWGANAFGQLGDGSTSGATTPRPVVGLPFPVSTIALGYSSTCASDGTSVWCWGRGREGQLGDGASLDTSAPVLAAAAIVDVDALDDNTNNFGTLEPAGQSFIVDAPATVTAFALRASRGASSSGSTFRIELRRDTIDGPVLSGRDLPITTLPAFTGTSPTWTSIALAEPVEIDASRTYFIVLIATEGDASDELRWSRSDANPYAGGTLYNGSTSVTASDHLFRVLGRP